MSIIIIFYIVGCLLSYMRVNAFVDYWKKYISTANPVFFISFITICSWIGFLTGLFFFIMEREKGEKFFKI